MRTQQLTGAALSCLLAAGLTGATRTPADARSVAVTDGHSQSAAVDITSVTYRNRAFTVGATVKVEDLAGTGKVLFVIARPDSDQFYYATVRVKSGGTVTTKVERVSNTSRQDVRCGDAHASWSAGKDRVRVSVPHTCLRFDAFLSRHWMRVRLSRNGSHDWAPNRIVGRGDSPGCVTQAEFRGVERGRHMRAVHSRMDTAGRFGDGGAGGFSRLYSACDGGSRYAVEYDGQTRRVIGKFRL